MKTQSRAFTLVELLVVIGIVALLISILIPTLGKARSQAQLTKCSSNMRQMAMAFHMYANENNGRFSMHVITYLNQARHNGMYPTSMRNQTLWDNMRKRYITDSWVTICPFFSNRETVFKDPYYYASSAIGGWEYERAQPAAAAPTVIQTAYMFLPNVKMLRDSRTDLTTYAPIDYAAGEPKWPSNVKEAKSQAAMISHVLQYSTVLSNVTDNGHGAATPQVPLPASGIPDDGHQLRTRVQPVAYGDGHVEVHRKGDIKNRASITLASGTIIYVWY